MGRAFACLLGTLAGTLTLSAHAATASLDALGGDFPPQFTASTVIAGTGVAGYSGDGGAATGAQLNNPTDPVIDSVGNIFFPDTNNFVVRRIDAVTGTISTYAGDGTSGFSGDGGAATSARFNTPVRLALDSADNLYIVDILNQRIRKVDAVSGIVTTVAGNGTLGSAGDGGQATSAQLFNPEGVTVAPNGDLYIIDGGSASLRRVDASTGIITTLAGQGFSFRTGDGGPASAAGLDRPMDVALDASGHIYIAESGASGGGAVVRKIDATTGIISTFAGDGAQTTGTGAPTDFDFGFAAGLQFDISHHDGKLYVTNNTHFYVIDLACGLCSHVAGGGLVDTFSELRGAALAANGDVILSDRTAQRVKRLTFDSTVATTSGAPPLTQTHTENTPLGGADYHELTWDNAIPDIGNFLLSHTHEHSSAAGTGPCPTGMRSDPAISGNLTVSAGGPAGTAELRFQFWTRTEETLTATPGDPSPPVTSLSLDVAWDLDGSSGSLTAPTGTGWVKHQTPWVSVTLDQSLPFSLSAMFHSALTANQRATLAAGADLTWAAVPFQARGVLGDENSGAYSIDLSDFGLAGESFPDCRLNAFPPEYTLLDLAGTGTGGYSGDGGLATSAEVDQPYEPIFDSAGNIYFTDHTRHVLRRVDAVTGIITTVAGTGVGGFSGDGGPATAAQLNGPLRLGIDHNDNLYIADQLNSRIRRINATTGIISTVVGNGTPFDSGNGGPATSASINLPESVTVAPNGDLYMVTTRANIRRVSAATGIISHIAGIGGNFRFGDGTLATGAGLDSPIDVSVDGAGNIYIAEIGLRWGRHPLH